MKKILVFMLIIGLISLMGCGAGPAGDSSGGGGGSNPPPVVPFSIDGMSVNPLDVVSGDKVTFYWDVVGAVNNIYTIEFYLSLNGVIDGSSIQAVFAHCGVPHAPCLQNGYEIVTIDGSYTPNTYDIIAFACTTHEDFSVECVQEAYGSQIVIN